MSVSLISLNISHVGRPHAVARGLRRLFARSKLHATGLQRSQGRIVRAQKSTYPELDAVLGFKEPWVLHDLRRTARLLMSRAGVLSDHAKRVLGHALKEQIRAKLIANFSDFPDLHDPTKSVSGDKALSTSDAGHQPDRHS